MKKIALAAMLSIGMIGFTDVSLAQPADDFDGPMPGEMEGPGGRGGPGGEFGGPGGGRGQGGPGGEQGGRRGFGGGSSPLMTALDKNEDGEISKVEMRKAAAALRSLDTDESGTVSLEELTGRGGRGGQGRGGRTRPGGEGEAGERGARGGRGGQGGDGRGGFGSPGGQAGQGDAGDRATMFIDRAMQFDADGDGMLSKEELTEMSSGFGRGGRGGRGGQGGGGRGGFGGPGGGGRGGPGGQNEE